ncbi:MAG: ABC transporter permease [Oscillospiraceae bacterium]|nr:ABC transporter permease [Oscillospiraceae bacterium]
MVRVKLFTALIRQSAGKLRREVILSAGLSLFCVFFALHIGAAAEKLLRDGVDFTALTIAVTAPEGDSTGETLSLWLGKMQDVKSYCTFVPMTAQEAEAALRRGDVGAVLALPSGFVDGVMAGENPDVTLTVSDDQPLDALLALWVGSSAADLLTAFQQGIFAVLSVYDAAPPQGLSRGDVVFSVNLRYIGETLSRGDAFRTLTVRATGALAPARHYGLSLGAFFLLLLAPILAPLYAPSVLRAQRRLRCLGYGTTLPFAAAVAAGALVLFPCALILLLPQDAALAAPLWALIASLCGCVLCLLIRSGAARATVSFLLSLLLLFLAGGILPQTMLPSVLRTLSRLTPISALRNAAVGDAEAVALLLGYAAMLALVGGFLYRARTERGAVE